MKEEKNEVVVPQVSPPQKQIDDIRMRLGDLTYQRVALESQLHLVVDEQNKLIKMLEQVAQSKQKVKD